MIGDRVRMSAYERAIASSVAPGSVVLDLGAGTGIFSFLACLGGAKHVYAVEPASAIQVGRESAHANGMQERITFIQDLSSRATLPEPVDLLIEDMRGALPWLGKHIPDLVDARRRFLKPGGQIISARDKVYCAVLEHEAVYRDLVRPWEARTAGLDLSAAKRYVLSSTLTVHANPDQLLSAAYMWSELVYASIESPHARGSFEQVVTRDGSAHGLLLWFDAELVAGITIANGPGNAHTCYRPVFLPLPEPVQVRRDDRVDVQLRGDLHGDDYLWTWDVGFRRPSLPGSQFAHFRQSTFFARPLTREALQRISRDHRPALDAKGEIARFVLDNADGATSLGELADRLMQRFPGKFAGGKEALAEAAGVVARYGR
jgi:precorrin-6B methylase 2